MVEKNTKEIRFKTFEDLEIYKKAREFRKKIYLLIKKLPLKGKYNLDPQMRKAIVSITNNIAEGHGRYHYQENIQFCRHSRGLLEEIIDDLNVCLDEGYFQTTYLEDLKNNGFELLKNLNGYIKYLKSMKDKVE
ncbi:MAG TPA: four helix bundle protein [bacterium]